MGAAALVVRLLFGADADLDLFVTDPLQETIYFANSPSRSGGRLVRDRRCGDPAPREEVVRFDAPPPGSYRIGIDFHRRCPGGEEGGEVLYQLQIERGGVAETHEGRAAPGHFDAVVLEFEVGPREGASP